MSGRRVPGALLVAVCACVGGPVASASGAWSAPQALASNACALIGPPQVAFPSEGPTLPTGPGAIVWASDPSCSERGPAGAPATFTVNVAAIGHSERPGVPTERVLRGRFSGQLGAVGADFGELAIAAGAQGTGAEDGAASDVLQGRSDRALGARAMTGKGLPFVITRAYLGDVAVATLRPRQIEVRVERWDRRGFEPIRVVPVGAGPVTAMALTMDYRSDILLAWQQSGSIFARVLRSHGSDDPTQRLGSSAPDPQLQALISDNNHGMVAWSSTVRTPGGGSPVTSTYIDISRVKVRFGAPALIASFSDPAEVGMSPGSLELVRVADENVEMAWTVAEDGHYAVRSAPAVYAASPLTTLLSNPAEDAVLADLSPGPANEAIALWTNGPRPPAAAGAEPPAGSELWEARTTIVPHDHVVLAPPEPVAAADPIGDPALAIDPANDDAVAAWLQAGSAPSIEYSVSRGAEDYRPHPPSAATKLPLTPGEWMGVAFAAGASAAEQALAAMTP